ncbi:hypothetical protein [Caenimonas soli]|uniref:hypothetical protein n=1 Tax=Caenimonas soli TaxID=2735555 RepID=UPI0015528661|nr:hypothetical protein [Caenimonas soli]NPC58893.1 hypothetical protein [Caenimonas soli]
MSDMRDARLRRALESAPDADLLPDRRTRRAVLDAARQALAPPPPAAWWQKLWQGMGNRSMPWNAALASVVIATLVTVLWREREIPTAMPDMAQTREPSPAAEPPVVSPPAQPSAAVTPPPAATPARKPAPATTKPQPAESPRERRAEAAVDAMRDQEQRELAKSVPSPQSAAPGAPAMSRAESTAAIHWTHLRIASQGRTWEVAREQAPGLAQLLNGMAREARSQEALEAAVTHRIELTREGQPAGVIELAGAQLRWTLAGLGGTYTTRPEPARLQALREEINRLAAR